MKLVDVLKPEYIKIPLSSSTKEGVIKELIRVLYEKRAIEDEDPVFQAAMEREKIMTTGVGRQVAIPHCKLKDCDTFSIAFGISVDGIDFSAIDEQPVKIVFLLVGPEENPGMHIRLLSRISRLISKETLREKLLQVKSREEAYDLLKTEEEKYFEIVS
jgi:fructose-specific phosphotransferase system IIA component